MGGESAVGGGRIADNDEYTPIGDTWSNKTDVPTPSRNQLSACGYNAKVYAFAGVSSGPTVDSQQNDEFDPSGNSWANKANLPSPVRRSSSYAVVGAFLYSWGGVSVSTYLLDNDQYNPSGNSWASKTDTPTPARDAICGGGSVDTKGYLLSGRNSALASLADNDEYDPSGDSWTSKTNISLARNYAAVCSFSSGVHVGGGSSGPLSAVHDRYLPASDSYESVAALSATRFQSAAFAP